MVILLVLLILAVVAVSATLMAVGRDGYGPIRTDVTRLRDPHTGWR